MYRKELESGNMTQKFAMVSRLRYVSDGDDYIELPTLEPIDQVLNMRQSPARSVGDEFNANVATNSEE